MTATITSGLGVRIWAALATVMDPELDEPITDLGFVRSHAVHGDDVEVHLRLPTFFCSPSFACMVAVTSISVNFAPLRSRSRLAEVQ